MARFTAFVPEKTIREIEQLYADTAKILEEMTRAGAEVVASNVKVSAPVADLQSHVKISRTYRTPTDGGVNTKVYFSGYIPFKGGRTSFSRRGRVGGKVYTTTKGIPADFLAQIFEYGRSEPDFPKKPFFRKSFKKSQIEKAMLKAQKKASGGVLDE